MTLQYYLETYSPTVLNLGCGKSCPAEHYGVDIADAAGVSLVADLNEGIPLPDDTFDEVHAIDFLEHIEQKNCIKIMEEIYRVLKPSGSMRAVVPSTDGNNIGAFQDPTHLSFWNRTKFFYFLAEEFGCGFRCLYNIKCWFKPLILETYYNQYDVTYVRAVLQKKELNG